VNRSSYIYSANSFSLSEYGCNTNKRAFEEVTSLYSTEMTPVYSGGLVYEYSEEGSKYGLVTVSGSTAKPLADFTALKSAFSKTANPSGDGGYNSTGGASNCPKKSANWAVEDDSLPAIPSAAAAYMKSGPGTGPGLSGKGSQNAGGQSTGTATPGSGAVSSGTGGAAATGTAKNSASSLQGAMSFQPMIVSGIVVAFTLVGATLL
jgi:hypothetical protein